MLRQDPNYILIASANLPPYGLFGGFITQEFSTWTQNPSVLEYTSDTIRGLLVISEEWIILPPQGNE